MASLFNIIKGLEIFDKHNGWITTGFEKINAGQASNKKLTAKEVLTLLDHQWSPDCGGCADEDDKKSATWVDDEDWDEKTDGPCPRHLYTCNEWYIFV